MKEYLLLEGFVDKIKELLSNNNKYITSCNDELLRLVDIIENFEVQMP